MREIEIYHPVTLLHRCPRRTKLNSMRSEALLSLKASSNRQQSRAHAPQLVKRHTNISHKPFLECTSTKIWVKRMEVTRDNLSHSLITLNTSNGQCATCQQAFMGKVVMFFGQPTSRVFSTQFSIALKRTRGGHISRTLAN